MIKKRMNKKEAEKYFRRQWTRFLVHERNDYDCRNDQSDRPFLFNDGLDYWIVFVPINCDDYLKIKIKRHTYKKFKRAGIYDMSKNRIKDLIKLIKDLPRIIFESWKNAKEQTASFMAFEKLFKKRRKK